MKIELMTYSEMDNSKGWTVVEQHGLRRPVFNYSIDPINDKINEKYKLLSGFFLKQISKKDNYKNTLLIKKILSEIIVECKLDQHDDKIELLKYLNYERKKTI